MNKTPKLRFKEFSGEWESKRLEKYIEYISSGKTKEKNECGTYKVYGSTGVIGYTEEPDYKGEHVLIARVGANAGTVNLTNEKCGISDNTLVIKYKDLLNYKFSYYQLIGYNLNRLIFGSGQPLITGGQLKSLKLKFPVFVEEQEKIASFFSLIDKKISLQSEKVEMLKQYKKGMMQKIFSRELRFKDDSGRDYPEWEEKKLGDVTKLTDGVHFTPTYVESGIPFWSVETIVSNSKPKYITEEAHKEAIKRCYPQYGDILLTRIGTLAKPKLVDWNEEFSIYVSVALIKSSDKFDSTFARYYFESQYYQKDFLSKSLLTATPKKINMEDLKQTHIKLPCLSEQKKIGKTLDLIERKLMKEQEKLDSLNEYKKGLLQQMFI